MTAGELRALLADVDADVEVVIRWNDDHCCHVAGVMAAGPEYGCTDDLAFMLDANTEET